MAGTEIIEEETVDDQECTVASATMISHILLCVRTAIMVLYSSGMEAACGMIFVASVNNPMTKLCESIGMGARQSMSRKASALEKTEAVNLSRVNIKSVMLYMLKEKSVAQARRFGISVSVDLGFQPPERIS